MLNSNGQVFVTASSAIGGGSSNTPTSFIATGSVTASVNVGTADVFTLTSGSTPTTLMTINSSGTITASGQLQLDSNNIKLESASGNRQLSVVNNFAIYNRLNTHTDNPLSSLVFGSNAVLYATASIGLRVLGSTNTITITGSIANPPTSSLIFEAVRNDGVKRAEIKTADWNAGFSAPPVTLYIYPGKETFGDNQANLILSHDGTNRRGNVGIGTSAPSYSLHINGSSASGSLNVNNTLYVSASRVGIGTESPTHALHISRSGETNLLDVNDLFQVRSTRIDLDTPSTYVSGTLFLGGDSPSTIPMRITQRSSVSTYYGLLIGANNGYNGSTTNQPLPFGNVIGFGNELYTTGSYQTVIGTQNIVTGSAIFGIGHVYILGTSNKISGSNRDGGVAQNRQIIIGDSNVSDAYTNTQISQIIIGNSNETNGYKYSTLIGSNIKPYGDNQLIFGHNAPPIDPGIKEVWFGRGVMNENNNVNSGNGAGSSVSINVSRAYSGSSAGGPQESPVSSSKNGGSLTLNGGQGTGTGSAGDVIIGTAVTESANNTTHHTLVNRVWVKGHTGNVGIGVQNPNARLEVSGSAIISGSLTVVTGSTEFQVLETGTKIGNSIADRHQMTGSLSMSGSIIGSASIDLAIGAINGQSPGGTFKALATSYGRPYATAVTVGNFTMTAYDNSIDLGSINAGLKLQTNAESLTGTTIPYVESKFLSFGKPPGPANVSRLVIGVNDTGEYTTGVTYPSSSNNYFYINAQLVTPDPTDSTKPIRRPIYYGARDHRFYTGETYTFANTPSVIISTSPSASLQVNGSTVLSGSVSQSLTLSGTPSNTSTPQGWIPMELNGSRVYIPYYT
jgi:hypothetical protein